MNKPISIIIPVKNGSNYLGEALGSIERQGMDVEVIVVDDGSTDATVQIAKDHGCKVVSHPVSRGQVAAKNTGLRYATGDYVMFLDHDDLIREGSLRVLLDALEADPAVAAVEAMVKDFLSPEVESTNVALKPEPFYGLFTGAILIRKSAFDATGPFSENVHTGEIMEWFSKMERNGLVVKKIDLVSADRRIHRTNFGQTNRATEMKNYAAVLRNLLKSRSGNSQ